MLWAQWKIVHNEVKNADVCIHYSGIQMYTGVCTHYTANQIIYRCWFINTTMLIRYYTDVCIHYSGIKTYIGVCSHYHDLQHNRNRSLNSRLIILMASNLITTWGLLWQSCWSFRLLKSFLWSTCLNFQSLSSVILVSDTNAL